MQKVNHGRLELVLSILIDDWVEAAWFVDSDELADLGADEGTLLLYRAEGPAGDFMTARSEDD
jgi:hypothetical protein